MLLFEQLYYQILLEAIWKTQFNNPHDINNEPFSYNLYKFYEMEYKLNMLLKKEFHGLPQRYENIKKNLQYELIDACKKLQAYLIPAFADWLEHHALTDPKKWAQNRLKQIIEISKQSGEDSVFKGFKDDYIQYSKDTDSLDQLYLDIQKYINSLPSIKAIIMNHFIPDQKEMILNDQDRLNNLQQEYNLSDSDDDYEKLVDIIDKTITIDDFFNNQDSYSFFAYLSSLSDFELKKCLLELYEHFVFPIWYDFWSNKGIDDTRENIEKIYSNLQRISEKDLGNFVVWINYAINASHQTGSMLDYVITYMSSIGSQDANVDIYGLLESLTNGKDIPKWNEQLKEIGVKI